MGELAKEPTPRRPQIRGDCLAGERPCPWVSCKWHLHCGVTVKGSLRLNWPDLEPAEIPETCALDVADRGAHTLEEVGDAMNLSRERIRQLERIALLKLELQLAGERLAELLQE